MGLLDKIIGVSSSSDTKKPAKVGKAEAGTIKAVATTKTGKQKEARLATPTPELVAVAWTDKTGKETAKAKCGKEIELRIETKSAIGCWFLIEMYSKDWKKPYQTKIIQVDGNHVDVPQVKAKEETIFRFKADAKWIESVDEKKIDEESIDKVIMTTKVYILQPFLNISFMRNHSEQFYSDELAAYYRGENNANFHEFDRIQQYGVKETKNIEVSKIVIVIDPGHGVKPGNVGGQSDIYKHKIKIKDEKGNLVDSENETGKYLNVEELPPYVLDDPEKYVTSKRLDEERTENFLAYDIATLMILILKDKKYLVINTRAKRDVWETKKDDKYAIGFRNEIANKNKADFFISIHADGGTKITDSGAHVIYNKGDDIGESFANHLLKYYSVVPIAPKSLRSHPSPRTNVGVVGSGNKTKYKALIELGFMKNPKDANAMHSQKKKIADQIVKALDEFINQKFE